MSQPSLIRRASRRCLNSVRRSLSRESHSQDEKSSLDQRSHKSGSKLSFSTSSVFTTTTAGEDEYKPLDYRIPEHPEKESPRCDQNHQPSPHFFRRLLREHINRNNGRKVHKSRSSPSFLTSSPRTTTTNKEDSHGSLIKPVLEDVEEEAPRYDQGQSHFFRRLPPEIREQIYREFWNVIGVKRHAFLRNRELVYSPCITDHEAPDERQIGLARDFKSSPEVQYHPKWFDRMESKWCNHWRCEELWEDIQDEIEVDYNHGQDQGFMALLLSCKRIYDESIDSFRKNKIINITNGPTLQRLIKYPRPRYLTEARIINISLREDSGNWLYLNGGNIWHILSEPEMKADRVYLWLDAECPVTRRLLPEFRALYSSIREPVAPKLTIDFPCDAEDGFWAWGETEVRTQTCGGFGEVTKQKEFVPEFNVVARGRQRFNETSEWGFVSGQDQGRPEVKVLREGNPFEDILLYGIGIHDDSCY